MKRWWACLLLCAGCSGRDSSSGTENPVEPTSSSSSSSSPTSGATDPPATSSSGNPTDATTTGTAQTSGADTGSSGGAVDGEPCGGGGGLLWAWGWAGENGENVDLVGDPGEQRIERMRDLSGRGNDYTNFGSDKPAYQVGYSDPVSGYQTDLPAVALHRYEGGPEVFEQFMFQEASLDAAGGFYLAFAGMNSRDNGTREMWGTTEDDVVRLDQTDNRVSIVIAGNGQQLTEDDAIDKGPLLLEIWRDDAGAITVFANGEDVTAAGAGSTNIFALSGIGHDQTGSSGWDDVAFEYIVCDALPTQDQRDFVRTYLNDKWQLY